MIYESLRAGDADIYRALELMREHDGMLLLHAESPDLLAALIAPAQEPKGDGRARR